MDIEKFNIELDLIFESGEDTKIMITKIHELERLYIQLNQPAINALYSASVISTT